MDMVDTDRRLCRPEESDLTRSRQPLELVGDGGVPGGGCREAGRDGIVREVAGRQLLVEHESVLGFANRKDASSPFGRPEICGAAG